MGSRPNPEKGGLKFPEPVLINSNRVTLDESQVNRHLLEIRKTLVEAQHPVDDNIPAQASLFDFASTFGSVPDNSKLQEEAKRQSQHLLREGRFRLSPNQRQVYYRLAWNQVGSLFKIPKKYCFFP